MVRFLFITFCLSGCTICIAQHQVFGFGANYAALANAASALKGPYAVLYNPAGIQDLKEPYAGVCYRQLFGLEQLSSYIGMLLLSTKYLNYGIVIQKSGDQLFNYNQITITGAKRSEMISIGASAGLLQMIVAESGSRYVPIIDFGAQADVTEKLTFGATVKNATINRYSSTDLERTPLMAAAGIAYAIQKLTLTGELSKTSYSSHSFNTGIEYRPVKFLRLRCGLQQRASVFSFGTGISHKGLVIDYTASQHPYLDTTHHLSLHLKIGKA